MRGLLDYFEKVLETKVPKGDDRFYCLFEAKEWEDSAFECMGPTLPDDEYPTICLGCAKHHKDLLKRMSSR